MMKQEEYVAKYVLKYVLILLLVVFSPAVYFFFFYSLPCQRLFSEPANNIIVTGTRDNSNTRGSYGRNTKFIYTYKNKIYKTGGRGDFYNEIPKDLMVFIELDSLKPDCYHIRFDSTFKNDTVIFSFRKSGDGLYVFKKKLIINNSR